MTFVKLQTTFQIMGSLQLHISAPPPPPPLPCCARASWCAACCCAAATAAAAAATLDSRAWTTSCTRLISRKTNSHDSDLRHNSPLQSPHLFSHPIIIAKNLDHSLVSRSQTLANESNQVPPKLAFSQRSSLLNFCLTFYPRAMAKVANNDTHNSNSSLEQTTERAADQLTKG